MVVVAGWLVAGGWWIETRGRDIHDIYTYIKPHCLYVLHLKEVCRLQMLLLRMKFKGGALTKQNTPCF